MSARDEAPTAGDRSVRRSSAALWGHRVSSWLLGSPPVQGLALVVLLLGLEVLAALATSPERRIEFAWFRVLALPLLSGYLLATWGAILAEAARALDDLAPELTIEPQERARLLRSLRAPPRAVRLVAAAGAVAVPVMLGLRVDELRTLALQWHPQVVAFGAMAVVFWWLLAQVAVVMLLQARCFDRLARDSLRVDLFDPSPLERFGRLALRNALLASGALALSVALAATPGSENAWLLRVEVTRGVGLLALLVMAGAFVGLVAMALPLAGIHRRLRDEKEQGLSQIAQALPTHRDAIASAPEAGTERIASLLTLRDALQTAPEWPLDAWMLRRFGLYSLLPAASWLLQVALEEGFGRVLGSG